MEYEYLAAECSVLSGGALGLAVVAGKRNNKNEKFILFDHDGVLVDTEFWYHKAGERALADIGFTLDKDQYLRDMNQSLGTWAQARAAGIDEQSIDRQREVRNVYYQEYLRTEAIEIEGVVGTLTLDRTLTTLHLVSPRWLNPCWETGSLRRLHQQKDQ